MVPEMVIKNPAISSIVFLMNTGHGGYSLKIQLLDRTDTVRTTIDDQYQVINYVRHCLGLNPSQTVKEIDITKIQMDLFDKILSYFAQPIHEEGNGLQISYVRTVTSDGVASDIKTIMKLFKRFYAPHEHYRTLAWKNKAFGKHTLW